MKDFFLTDNEIQDLIDEPKQMKQSAATVIRGMQKKSGRGASFLQNSVKFSRNSGNGDCWLIYLRHNQENMLDFSCGLGFIPKGRTKPFMLRRYNGKSHEHTNRLEAAQPFYNFHIHQATEKYQLSSYAAEHYAYPTNLYADIFGAFKSLLDDCKVNQDVEGKQTSLF